MKFTVLILLPSLWHLKAKVAAKSLFLGLFFGSYCLRSSSVRDDFLFDEPQRSRLGSLKAWVAQGLGRSTVGSLNGWVAQGLGRSTIGSLNAWVAQRLGRSTLGSLNAWVAQRLGRARLGSLKAWVAQRWGQSMLGHLTLGSAISR